MEGKKGTTKGNGQRGRPRKHKQEEAQVEVVKPEMDAYLQEFYHKEELRRKASLPNTDVVSTLFAATTAHRELQNAIAPLSNGENKKEWLVLVTGADARAVRTLK